MVSVLHHRRQEDRPGGQPRRRRRRWPWVVLASVVVVVGGLALATWIRHSPAKPVTVNQAQGRYRSSGLTGPTDRRPPPGVYAYSGTGTDRLTVPSLSQKAGPTMPVTVTLRGDDCWTMRVDYSTHHWQTWDYCLSGGKLVQTGGHLWMLWQVGPLDVTNQTSLTCSPPLLVVAGQMAPSQTWAVGCSGTSTAVKGLMTSFGTTLYLGDETLQVGGRSVATHHLVESRTDTGSQKGTERYETWVATDNGLPVKMVQDIQVKTSTPFGDSTYTQSSTLTLTDLQPRS